MIYIAIGSNLPTPRHPSALHVCRNSVDALAALPVRILATSRWYRTAPVPVSDQPWFVNGVVAVSTDMAGDELLHALHDIEADFGRVRRQRYEARVLDLDLLDYKGMVQPAPEWPTLPHPRLIGRAFVLRPLADIAPNWRHPVSGVGIGQLLAALPTDQQCELMSEEIGSEGVAAADST
jgi:2-amino-4-hydroxy-6-hydroxymethyldihydropteridine diphosphokinase